MMHRYLDSKTESDFKRLIQLLESDSNDKVVFRKDFNNLYLVSETTETELMLRFSSYHKQITIARIALIQHRKGTFTKILRELSTFDEQFKSIVIESVLTEEMTNYLKKHNWEETIVPFNYEKDMEAILKETQEL